MNFLLLKPYVLEFAMDVRLVDLNFQGRLDCLQLHFLPIHILKPVIFSNFLEIVNSLKRILV